MKQRVGIQASPSLLHLRIRLRAFLPLAALGTLVFLLFSVLDERDSAPSASASTSYGYAASVPTSDAWKFWTYEDLKVLDPWGDSDSDARDIVAVYFKQEERAVYFRVDLLDIRDDNKPNLYVAIDYKPGGEKALGKGGPNLTADISWDLLLVSEAGRLNALDADFTDHPAYITRGTVDIQLDYIEFALTSDALSDWDGKPFEVQALIVGGAPASIVDKSTSASTSAVTGRGKLVMIFGNMFAGYGPHAVSWYDGFAFTPPTKEGQRVGLKYLLDAIETYEVPLTTNDLRVDVLAANDYLGISDRLRRLAQRNLLDPLPTLTYGYFMPWQPADVDAVAFRLARQAWEEFGLPQGKVFYPYEAMLTPADLEGIKQAGYPAVLGYDRYGYLFGWIKDWGNSDEVQNWYLSSRKVHKANDILFFFTLQGFAWDPRWDKAQIESGWHLNRYDSFEGTDGGLHHAWRRVLLDMALDPDQEQYIAMGTDLMLTSWFLPGEAERSARWIASHPWIEATTMSSLLGKKWTPIEHGDLGMAPDQPLERYPLEDDQHYNAYFWQSYYGGISDGHSPLVPKGTQIEGYFDYVPYLRHGQRIPSGMKMGDDKTPGTIVYETLRNLRAAPDNDLTRLAWHGYFLHIPEQTLRSQYPWKGGEDPGDVVHGAYLNPGAKTHANLMRQVNKIVAGAQWAQEAAQGRLSDSTEVLTKDLDLDGENEYVIRNNKVFAIFENDGGVLEYAFVYDPTVGAVQLVGPTYNLVISSLRNYEDAESLIAFPSVETAFEESEPLRYAVFDVAVDSKSLTFTSPDGTLRKSFTLDGNMVKAHYSTGKVNQTTVQFALNVNPGKMFAQDWWQNVTSLESQEAVGWQNAKGGYALVTYGDAELLSADSFLDSPARDEKHERKDPPYPAGHWLFFPYHTVTIKGIGEFDAGLTLSAKPSEAASPASGAQATGRRPLPLVILAALLLVFVVGAVGAFRLRGKRK